MRRFRAEIAARCRLAWQRASQTRCLMSGSFPKVCVVVLVVLGLLVMADLIPRMVILATEARETSYWESWEEAYIDQESGKPAPQKASACMSQHCRCLFSKQHVLCVHASKHFLTLASTAKTAEAAS